MTSGCDRDRQFIGQPPAKLRIAVLAYQYAVVDNFPEIRSKTKGGIVGPLDGLADIDNLP